MPYTRDDVARFSDEELRAHFNDSRGVHIEILDESQRRFGDHDDYGCSVPMYSASSPIDDYSQARYLLDVPHDDEYWGYIESGNAARDLSLLQRSTLPIYIHSRNFTCGDFDQEALPRDEYWELMYAAARIGRYLDDMREWIRACHNRPGERLDPRNGCSVRGAALEQQAIAPEFEQDGEAVA